MALFPVILPDRVVLDKAQELHVQQRWSYWDAMIVAACLAGGVNKLYTEDLPGGETIDPLEIVNPFK